MLTNMAVTPELAAFPPARPNWGERDTSRCLLYLLLEEPLQLSSWLPHEDLNLQVVQALFSGSMH